VFDYLDASNYKYAGMDGTNGQWVIREVISGTDTLRASVAGTIVKGTLYDVEVQISGSLATLKVGGVVKTSYTFDGMQGGQVGLRIAQAHTHFKEVYLRAFSQVTKYYAFGGQRIAMRRDHILFFLAADHLGTVSMVLDAAGNVVDESRHYPYGTERWALDGAFPTDYRFTGQLLDSSLGLYHMGARQYDPMLGRWLSADTLVPEPANPQSLNRYSYVLNRPLRFLDPTGHKEEGECGFNGESCSEGPPDWVVHLLADPEFYAWLLAQVDSWLWGNVPSAVGDYLQLTVTGGAFFEGEISVQLGAMFNWRTGELTFLYGLGSGVYLGTPRGMSASVSGGGMFTWGASESASLMGVDACYGANAQIDAVAEAGVEMVGSTSLYYDDVNDNGRLDLHDNPAVFVDPVSHRPVSTLQVGLNAGANGLPNAMDAGVVGGLSITAGFNIISGWDSKVWPWNW